MDSTVAVSYENSDHAQQAVEQLNGYEYQGSSLKVDYASNGNSRGAANGAGPKNRPPRNSGTNNRGTGLPLRMLVPTDMVGAIIGRKGATIRNITTQCKARIDVHRDNSAGLLEKVISIYGQPDNCSNACKEIMKVMLQEAASTNYGEVILKLLVDNHFCGRLIGREGKVINKLRQDTGANINISNTQLTGPVGEMSYQDAPALYPDRVVTIRGNLDSQCSAEAAISAKIREFLEREAKEASSNMMMQHPMGMPMVQGNMYPGMRQGPYGGMMGSENVAGAQGNQGYYGGGNNTGGMYRNVNQQQHMGQHPQPLEQVQISVPDSSVGAIIGSGGSNIKTIIQDSHAYVTIDPKKDNAPDKDPAAERTVTIKGGPDAIWTASFLVYDKLKQEGFAGSDDVRLRTSIKVPKSVVGRVIGKGGKNVRELQRKTGAMIKLPEPPENQGDDVVVEIFGQCIATQNAISGIRGLVTQGLSQQALMGVPPPPPPQQRRRGPRGPPPGPGQGQNQ